MDKRSVREEVRKLWKEIRMMEIEEIREVNIRKEGERRMAVVKLKDKEGKKEVMVKKKH